MSEKRYGEMDEQDQTVADSFPASDPPSHAATGGPGRARREEHPLHDAHESGHPKHGEHRTPKGGPNSDRHAAETAAARIAGVTPPETDHR
jgi:hypothetical protein